MLFEFDGEQLHLRAWGGFDPDAAQDYLRQFPMRPDRGTAVGRVILERRVVHIRDVSVDPDIGQAVRTMGVRSTAGVPLLRGGQAIGVIAIGSSAIGGFTDLQIELLRIFAEQAVIAIGCVATSGTSGTHRRLTRSVAELQALEEVLRAVNSSLDLDTVLATIISRAAQLSQADEGTIYEFDEAEEVLCPGLPSA